MLSSTTIDNLKNRFRGGLLCWPSVNASGEHVAFCTSQGEASRARSVRPVSVFLTVGSNTAMNMLSKPVERCRKTSYSLNLSLVLILSESALHATSEILLNPFAKKTLSGSH